MSSFRKPLQTETKRRDALLRVDLLIQAYNEMGYDVVNVGEKDLLMGLKFLSDVSQKATFSLVSANLVDKKTGKGIFKPYVIKDIGRSEDRNIWALRRYIQLNPSRKEILNCPFLEPFSTSKALTKNLRESCDLIVVLSQLGESKDRKLTTENPQIDLILGGGGESKRALIERVNEVPIYRLEPRGGFFGMVNYSFVDQKKPIKFLISSERDEMEKRLERLISHSIQIKTEIAKSGKQDEVKLKES